MPAQHSGGGGGTLEVWALGVMVGVVITSVWALVLLAVGEFRPGLVGGGALVGVIGAGLLVLRRGAPRSLRLWELGVLGCMVLGLVARSNPATFLFGGQDPGVYANTASYFARHGESVVRDPLLPILGDRPDLKALHVERTFRRAEAVGEGRWVGNLVPGLYLRNLDTNEWIPQFYYVNSIWLAIGQWIFGVAAQGWILVLFAAGAVGLAGLVTYRLTGSGGGAVLASSLLALNPAHAGIATFPVSETVAGFFFLGVVLALVARRYGVVVGSALGLFLTRITGFVTLPLLLAGLLWWVVRRRDGRAVGAGIGLIGAYAASYYWGLAYSTNYVSDIYRGKLGIPPSLLDNAWIAFGMVTGVWCAVCFVVLRRPPIVRRVGTFLVRHRTALAVGVVTLILGAAIYRGYLLAFTEHYMSHRWFGKRWGMAGNGFDSVKHLSLYTLGLMVSPVVFFAAIGGIIYVARRSFRRAVEAPVAILAVGFLGALTVKQLTVPYMYYFGRYLVSELVPLALICAVVFLVAVWRARPRLMVPLTVVVVGSYLWFLTPTLLAQRRVEQGREFLEALQCIDAATPGKSVILIDKRMFAESPVVTPLRLSFDKPTFSLRKADFPTDEKMADLLGYFAGKGFTVYLLSSQTTWEGVAGLRRIVRVPMIMRTIGGRGGLPKRVRSRNYPVRLYGVGEPGEVPEICRRVAEYKE